MTFLPYVLAFLLSLSLAMNSLNLPIMLSLFYIILFLNSECFLYMLISSLLRYVFLKEIHKKEL